MQMGATELGLLDSLEIRLSYLLALTLSALVSILHRRFPSILSHTPLGSQGAEFCLEDFVLIVS